MLTIFKERSKTCLKSALKRSKNDEKSRKGALKLLVAPTGASAAHLRTVSTLRKQMAAKAEELSQFEMSSDISNLKRSWRFWAVPGA